MNKNNEKKVCLKNSREPPYALKSEIEKQSRIILSSKRDEKQTASQSNTKSQNNANGAKQNKQ